MDPTQIIEALSGLDPDELQAIAAALRDLLAARDSPTVVTSVPDVVAERMVRGVTYRLEHVRCGKLINVNYICGWRQLEVLVAAGLDASAGRPVVCVCCVCASLAR